MNKNKKCIKKILSFALALVMFFSPIFLSGCFDGVTSNGIGSNQNQQTTPNNPTGGSAGGNSGGNSGETTGSEQDDEEDLDDRESLQYEQYDDFFKNYRITYNPKLNIDRTTFTEELDKQNVSVANKIVSQLELEYKVGTKTIKDVNENSIEVSSSLFSNNIDNSDLRIDDTNIFYLIKQPKTDYVIDVNNSTLEYFSHEHAITEDNNQFGNTGWVAKDDTTGGILADYKTNIQFAELLILAGYTLEEDGSGDFDSEYRSHLDSSGKVRSEDFEDIYAKVNHLGFTQSEMRQIQYYVLNYIIGKNLVDYDNTRFVNVYYDGGYAKVVKNNNYNRFLTDETYATAMEETSSNFANGSLIDYTSTSNIDEINATLGLMEYATNYLGYSSLDNFNLKTDAYDSSIKYFDPSRIDYDFATTDYSITEEEKHSTSDSDYLNSDLKQLFSQKIYEVLIKTKYRNSNFNANFWDYDADGNLLSGDGNKTVVATIDGVQRILYSVRLPYFKNYFNTTFKIVNEVVNSEASFETKTQWELIHGSAYPYDDEYPSVPLTYFADYDNGDMLFDGKSSCAKMFSGYQNYQSMVLMPQKTVELDSGALFITRQLAEDEAHFEDGSTDGYGDFELTIYARFYDASTQSYAMWEGEDGTFSEFYIIDTITVLFDAYEEGPEEDMEEDEEPDEDIPDDEEDYEPDNPDDEENDPGAGLTNLTPNVVDFSIKKILKSAFVNGTQVESNLLEGFDENSVLSKHHSTLITKENYGYLFNYVDTPDGKQVVCFDGKKAGAPSYFELVFSCPEDCKFQFCFYPTVAFDPQVA